jgi:hypothetical protein
MTQATYIRTMVLTLDQLTPFPGNAKRGDVDVILTSLRRNGQYRGLVVREDSDGHLIILAGNHTAQALAQHGPGPCEYRAKVNGKERPCGVCQNETWEPSARVEVVTCDGDTARRINLVDNRSADLGEYDNDALAELLSYVEDDYEGTGYNAGDVNRLLFVPPAEDLEEFPAYDESVPTSYTCPKCSYSWSGKPE